MADRSKIAAKIAALRAKTTGAGATEAEALAAAELAARLMAEHGLSDADIEMVSASAPERTVRATWRSILAAAVSSVTNTASILHPVTAEIEFIGRDPGPVIAAYLYTVLVRAVERAAREFKETTFYRRRRTTKTRKAALNDFATAMVLRLRFRLYELFAATIDKGAQETAWRALTNRYPTSTKMTAPKRKEQFSAAADAGYRAGGDVTLAHGVAGADGRPLAIGGARG